MLRQVILMAVVVSFLLTCAVTQAVTWTTFDYPGAPYTRIYGIDGDSLVGAYSLSVFGDTYSFFYNGTTGITLQMPEMGETTAYGITGDSIVGMYRSSTTAYNGFLRQGTTWTTLNYPGARGTLIYGIDGSNVVGTAIGATVGGIQGTYGAIYNLDSQSWSTISFPGAIGTYIYGIDGQNIAGHYIDAGTYYGFFYNGTTWTTFDLPGDKKTSGVGGVTDVSGNNVVGWYQDSEGHHGFIFNKTSWSAFDVAGQRNAEIYGIEGDKVFGSYQDANNYIHGFIATIPEPATVFLVGVGGILLRRK